MKLVVAFLVLLKAHAAALPEWQKCLDMADFEIKTNKFLESSTIHKKGCEITIVHLDARPKRYVFNVCDSDITLQRFDNLEQTQARKLRATSANCALPMFGMDFEAEGDDSRPYEDARADILRIVGVAKDTLQRNKEGIGSADKASLEQINCVRTLIDEYLVNCVALEGKPEQKDTRPVQKKFLDTEEPPKDLPPGIHPATILKKK